MKDDDRLNILLGKQSNEALDKMLGRKDKEGHRDKDSTPVIDIKTMDKKIRCPKCGHKFSGYFEEDE
jgi:hypothetical protein